MKTERYTIAALLALVLAASAFSVVAVGPAHALGDIVPDPDPEPEPTKGNNGWGQEKRGLTDGTNAGSFQGGGGSPTQEATKTESVLR